MNSRDSTRHSMRRTAVWLAAVAYVLVMVFSVLILYVANEAHSAAHHSDAAARRVEAAVEHNRALAAAIGNAATATYKQTTCRVELLATLDTQWRRALNDVLHAYIDGDVGTAQAALSQLQAAATVDIQATIAQTCP